MVVHPTRTRSLLDSRFSKAIEMDIDFTNSTSINPERRTVFFANRTVTVGELVEAEFMVGVDDVAEVVGEAGAI